MASSAGPSTPPDDFVGRVMTSVTHAALPSASRSLVDAIRERSLTEVVGAVVVAAHLALAPGRVPAAIRAQALVLVAIVALVAGTGATLAATTAVSVARPILARSVDPARDDGARPSPTPAPAEIAPVPAVAMPTDLAPGVVRAVGSSQPPVSRPQATPEAVDGRDDGDDDAEAARPPRSADDDHAGDGDAGDARSDAGSDGDDRATDGGDDGDDRATDDEHRDGHDDEATDDPGGHDSGDGDDGDDGHDGADDGGDGGDAGDGGGGGD